MFIYALKSAITLSLLYLPYMLMLRRESFFRFNRAVLLCIMLMSLTLPLCNVAPLSLDDNPVVNAAQQQMIEVGVPIRQSVVVVTTSQTTHVSWFSVVAALYALAAIALLCLRLRDFILLQRIVRHDCAWTRRLDHGITLYCHRGKVPPFSWGRSIVVDETDYAESGEQIVLHEVGHILCRHSWDVMLLTLCQLVQWFNPLVWMMGQSLADVHEYEADDYVLRQGISPREYQMLLIKKAVGSSRFAFVNNFNHSLLKKRINMMCTKKSNPWLRAKVLYAAPVALIALSAFATPEFTTASEALDKVVAPSKESTEAKSAYIVGEETADASAINLYITAKGEMMMGSSAGAAERINPAEAMKVIAQNQDMTLNIIAEKGLDISTLAGFKARGRSNGKLKINYREEVFDFVDEGEEIYSRPEVNAQFPGGDAALMEWVQQNKQHPEDVKNQGGHVIINMVVEKDGSITNVRAIRSPHKSFSDEAIRLVKAMPRWKPAQEGGKPVRSYFNIPVLFKRPS